MPETPVRIGELVVTNAPEDVLMSVGLGSCIGLAMIDRSRGVIGLAHVMLPETDNGPGPLPGRYANHAVPILLDEVVKLGAQRTSLEVGIAGGAQMFAASNTIEIGRRNEEAVRAALSAVGLRLRVAETGGDKGRTVRVHNDGGVMTVREVASPERVLLGSRDLVGASR